MKIVNRDYTADRIELGDRFLIGNGSFGYRGTLEEQRKDSCVALTASGFFDKADGWREPVNMPNPLYTSLTADGCKLGEPIAHTEELDLSTATYSRRTTWAIHGGEITVSAERFFSESDPSQLYAKYSVTSTVRVRAELLCGIDCNVWDINGPHFTVKSTLFDPPSVLAVTNEGKRLSVTLLDNRDDGEKYNSDGIIGSIYRAEIDPEHPFAIEKCAIILHDNQHLAPPPSRSAYSRISPEYDEAKRKNDCLWQKKWNSARVIISEENETDPSMIDSQTAIDYSVYQLMIYAPKEDGVSISARGLSGQTYKGAVFWDTEMFMLPFYKLTDPEVARRLVKYRIKTLGGAKEKAKHYGFDGAFYAWESHEDGRDACSDFNVTDVFTGRPVRTYFKDKQIHISADVAVAMFRYMKDLGDFSLLSEGALDVLFECSLFYLSYSYYNMRKGRAELLDVIGPDEYHERVNNNAYTNYMAHECCKNLFEALDILQESDNNAFVKFSSEHQNELENIRDFMNKLYLPTPDARGVIEQFDGYFGLEDVLVDTVRERLAHPKEYWGGSGGVATATRVIKQADVVTLMCVLPERFSVDTKRANYEFYLPYTEHGSSLSASMYALCAAMIGRSDDAYEWFYKTATADLRTGGKRWAGGIYIGGTHPAAAGGAWMSAVLGFAKHGLPKQIKGIYYKTAEM